MILREHVKTLTTAMYRCRPLVDLCRTPHMRHTGKIKAFQITKYRNVHTTSSCWEGTAEKIYGIPCPDTTQPEQVRKFQEEAAKHDHRKIGEDQELFFIHEMSPGSCFFLPKGAFVYNALIALMKSEYRKRGFSEVMSPNFYNSALWETSGHWQDCADSMFSTEVKKETHILKPMNCQFHCLMFDHRTRSWKQLPLRLADFGVLHRKASSGALSGLTSLRRFQQDDAHIFCRPDQIKQEIAGCLDFLQHVYKVLGFTFSLQLATRPEKFFGEIEKWDAAEKQLTESLDAFGEKWEHNPGNGAFHGPKIDVTIQDALCRAHQCATIQLDFQLPQKFNLTYIGDKGSGDRKRPVIIQRTILGSLERMIAILCENYGGKWPFWISPRQVIVVPVAPPFDEYAQKVKDEIYAAGFQCETDLDAGDDLNKKIRNAELAQFNFIFVVGEKEQNQGTVTIRTRDNKVHGEHSVAHVISRFNDFSQTKILDAEEKF